MRPLAILAASALAFGLPWLIKNQVMLGNPVSPFANRLFPNRVIQPAFEDDLARRMKYLNSVRPSEVPLETTVRGVRLTGVVGPVFLLAPLGLLALRLRAGRQLLLAALVFGVPYFSNLGTRFLIPCLPFVAMAMGLAVGRPLWLGCVAVLSHAVLSYPLVLSMYLEPGAWRLEGMPWQAALRVMPEERFLREALPAHAMILRINKAVRASEKVFSLSSAPQLYCNPELVISGQSSQTNSYRDILLTGVLAELRPTQRYRLKFAPHAVDGVRISVRIPAGAAPWSVTEVRFGRGGSEVARGSRWRLRTSTNIWEAPWAFDNNPVTRWTAGETGGEAQYIEVNFGGEVSVDSVWLDGPAGPSGVGVGVQLRGPDGVWLGVETEAGEERLEPPARLRRASIETLRQEGLGWLLVHERDLGAQDFAERGRQWGITLVARERRLSLYRFD